MTWGTITAAVSAARMSAEDGKKEGLFGSALLFLSFLSCIGQDFGWGAGSCLHRAELRSGRRKLPCGVTCDDNVTPECNHIGSCNVLFISSGGHSVGDLTPAVSEQCMDLQLFSPSSLC